MCYNDRIIISCGRRFFKIILRKSIGSTCAWEQRKVGTFASVLSASRVHKDEWRTEGVPFYRSSDVVSAFKGNDNERAFISTELYEELIKSSGRLEKGDILITGGGSIGIPYIVPNNEPLYSKDADLIWIKKSAEHDSQYLYAYFTSQGFREYISSISHVGTIAHYTIEQVKDTPVLLPSVAEQSAIGLFFSQLDTLITLHQRKYDKLVAIKKSMLEKMFPREESRFPEIRFAGFTDPWEQRKLLDCIQKITDFRGRTPKKLGMDWSETGYLALSALNVKDGYIDFSQDVHYGDQALYDKWMTGNELHKGQVLFTTEAPMGNVAQIPDNRRYILSQRTIAFDAKSDLITENFLATILRTPTVFASLTALSSGGTAKGVSQKSLATVDIILPVSLEEQEQLASMFAGIDTLITLHQRERENTDVGRKEF